MYRDELFLTKKQILRLFHNKKEKVLRVALICFALTCAWKLLQKPMYATKATFRQEIDAKRYSEKLKTFLDFDNNCVENSIISVMSSYTVLGQVIADLGLQAQVQTSPFLLRVFARVGTNIFLSFGGDPKEEDPFVFRKVVYDGKDDIHYFLRKGEGSSLELVTDKKKNVSIPIILGESVRTSECQFTLASISKGMRPHKLYPLTIAPCLDVYKQVSRYLQIDSSKEDRSLLRLHYLSMKKTGAALFLNCLMDAYREYLEKQNEAIAASESAYFKKKQEDLLAEFERCLTNYTGYLAKNVGDNGFMSLRQALELLEQPKEDYLTKLLEVELELKRLDSIEPPQEEKKSKKEKLQEPFEKQQVELHNKLEQVEQDRAVLQASLQKSEEKEVQLLLDALRTGDLVPADLTILQNTDLPVGSLYTQIKEITAAISTVSIEEKGALSKKLSECKNSLKSHLLSLKKQIGEKKQILLQESMLPEFEHSQLKGIDPETVQKLYVDYNNQLDAVQVNIEQLIYLRNKILDPDFEVSSIGNLLGDSISQEMIHKAGQIALELRDDINRSAKEHQRLKEALILQKRFLVDHIGQMIDISILKTKLFEEKIRSLQETSIGLLETEKSLIQDRLSDIKKKMTDLPENWRRENELSFQKELLVNGVSSLIKIAEERSIKHRLFQIGSRPLDAAITPHDPISLNLFSSGLFSAFAGAFVYFFGAFFSWMRKSPYACAGAFHHYRWPCVGEFSPFCDRHLQDIASSDVEVYRRIGCFLSQHKEEAKPMTVCLLDNIALSYHQTLASYVSLLHGKILLMDMLASPVTQKHNVLGVYSYLRGELDSLPVQSMGGYDYIPSGSCSPFSLELLSQKRFSQAIEALRQKYDVVLLRSGSICATHSQALLSLSDLCVVTAHVDTPLEELEHLLPEKERGQAPLVVFAGCQTDLRGR